ncbi:hypothetical protein RND81_12G178400 [Saponaria officinalis]|uniref:THUMP domain-containing protein n=1 Tax=Saponaria officinalis TaxID=3572 RepID=A0AAW1HC54_SAPOF
MTAENNPKSAPNDPKKRKRCYLPHNKAVRKKGGNPIRAGVEGFFITCDGGREFQAAQEAINVIDSFFEELIDGKESSSKVAVTSEKPLNKKITFSYSDSDEEEEDEDDDDGDVEKDGKEDNKSVNPQDGLNNGSKAEEISDPVDKAEKLHDDGSAKTEGGDKEVIKEQEEEKSKDNEEPPEKKHCADDKKSENGNQALATTETSVDKLIEAELKELKDKSKRRFSKLDTGCNGVVFIQMRRRDGDPSPRDIVQHMMESAAATKKHMSRFLLRVLPVELSCYASEEEISRAIKPLVEQHFPVNTETPVKFAVQYDARANSGIERMKIIDAIAKSIPEPHKVDLKNPEKTIIAQVVKTVCMIGVVDKYKELAKFNLRQLTS